MDEDEEGRDWTSRRIRERKDKVAQVSPPEDKASSIN